MWLTLQEVVVGIPWDRSLKIPNSSSRASNSAGLWRLSIIPETMSLFTHPSVRKITRACRPRIRALATGIVGRILRNAKTRASGRCVRGAGLYAGCAILVVFIHDPGLSPSPSTARHGHAAPDLATYRDQLVTGSFIMCP